MAGYDLRAGGRRALGLQSTDRTPDPVGADLNPPHPKAEGAAIPTMPQSKAGRGKRRAGAAASRGLPGTQRSRGTRQLNVSVPPRVIEQIGEALAADPSATIGDFVLAALQRLPPLERSSADSGPFAVTRHKARRQLGGARALAFYLTHDQAAALQELARGTGQSYSSLVTDALDAYLANPKPTNSG